LRRAARPIRDEAMVPFNPSSAGMVCLFLSLSQQLSRNTSRILSCSDHGSIDVEKPRPTLHSCDCQSMNSISFALDAHISGPRRYVDGGNCSTKAKETHGHGGPIEPWRVAVQSGSLNATIEPPFSRKLSAQSTNLKNRRFAHAFS